MLWLEVEISILRDVRKNNITKWWKNVLPINSSCFCWLSHLLSLSQFLILLRKSGKSHVIPCVVICFFIMVGVGSSQVASHHKYPTEAWLVGSICRLPFLSSGFVWDFQLMIHDRNEEDIFLSPIEKRTSFQWPHHLLCLWHCVWGRSQLSQVVRLERAAKVHLQWWEAWAANWSLRFVAFEKLADASLFSAFNCGANSMERDQSYLIEF